MQIFPRSFNRLPLLAGALLPLVALGGVGGAWYYLSPSFTQVGYEPQQPVPFSHRLHAGELGLDCRYCHSEVERSAEANVPATQTCMNCHTQVRVDSKKLAKVRESWAAGASLAWVRVHRLPDHAYFDHSAHLTAGVGCSSCHGRVDQMDVVRQVAPLSMGWCLECHRDPTPHLRPPHQVTQMAYVPAGNVAPARAVQPPQHCSGCHR